MKAWPRMITLAVRSVCSPRIGRSLALSLPWSFSTRLLAYWVVSRFLETYTSMTWSTSIPCSARISSRSRYDSPKRRYQRTANKNTSGGNPNPANDANPVWMIGHDRRRFIRPASPRRATTLNATDPREYQCQ